MLWERLRKLSGRIHAAVKNIRCGMCAFLSGEIHAEQRVNVWQIFAKFYRACNVQQHNQFTGVLLRVADCTLQNCTFLRIQLQVLPVSSLRAKGGDCYNNGVCLICRGICKHTRFSHNPSGCIDEAAGFVGKYAATACAALDKARFPCAVKRCRAIRPQRKCFGIIFQQDYSFCRSLISNLPRRFRVNIMLLPAAHDRHLDKHA